nr:MAG TPA: hypothetical protein [Caudoviricetes sp.]
MCHANTLYSCFILITPIGGFFASVALIETPAFKNYYALSNLNNFQYTLL